MFSEGNKAVQYTGMLTNFLIELLSYFYPFFSGNLAFASFEGSGKCWYAAWKTTW